jgi:hypothetical protein
MQYIVESHLSTTKPGGKYIAVVMLDEVHAGQRQQSRNPDLAEGCVSLYPLFPFLIFFGKQHLQVRLRQTLPSTFDAIRSVLMIFQTLQFSKTSSVALPRQSKSVTDYLSL